MDAQHGKGAGHRCFSVVPCPSHVIVNPDPSCNSGREGEEPECSEDVCARSDHITPIVTNYGSMLQKMEGSPLL
jgi:hypothetical protein